MRSLRSRLSALWLMLALSGAATAYLLVESFQQSSEARVGRAQDLVVRGCRDIADRYQFFVSGWRGAPIDDRIKHDLIPVVQSALAASPGVEGGIWQAEHGSLAYAYPTYEGTGPKTDLPAAELSVIQQVNASAERSGHPATTENAGRSQTLIVHACPLRGPLQNVTAWTMTRAATAEGPAYTHLLTGLSVLALTLLGSAIWLAFILASWSRRIAMIESALGASTAAADLPQLPRTGARELDRLVDAVNDAGNRLAAERERATAAERLAAVGRLSANLAHEIRNPIAAMRLKAENALASPDPARKSGALEAILQQVARLDALLRDLLAMTHASRPATRPVDLAGFLQTTIETHRELAARRGLRLRMVVPSSAEAACFDPAQMQRALDNLILNAIQNTPEGGEIVLAAEIHDARLLFRVTDSGQGIDAGIRNRLFEPFVSTRADGTGLGLAIVREIARAHRGEARLAPVSTGTSVEISLPWPPS
ncbi:HAMP domain-containing sensor histidine kinase [Bradyrhizobium sp. STM 3809]|uniref:sensor histidine kinase n=1 Tax=Bradyrhizobium sp. STM 3809 TaxID=551936 RepID=UPI00024060AA|nr:HAMP domain-containing sensor histidine kinase [Bradyrhizobium sp. STM 3809]CCE02242.1 putative two-component system sensor protein [Bradyrhizobium sp. STM 3809]